MQRQTRKNVFTKAHQQRCLAITWKLIFQDLNYVKQNKQQTIKEPLQKCREWEWKTEGRSHLKYLAYYQAAGERYHKLFQKSSQYLSRKSWVKNERQWTFIELTLYQHIGHLATYWCSKRLVNLTKIMKWPEIDWIRNHSCLILKLTQAIQKAIRFLCYRSKQRFLELNDKDNLVKNENKK